MHRGRPHQNERARADRWARRYGIDPDFLWAIRKTEGGGRGREFGVLYRGGAGGSFDGQARLAAETVRNTLERYRQNKRREPVGPDGRYTESFIRYFSRGGPGYPGYAPVGTKNDPKNLNQHHLPNMLRHYRGGDVDPLKPTENRQQGREAQEPFGRPMHPLAPRGRTVEEDRPSPAPGASPQPWPFGQSVEDLQGHEASAPAGGLSPFIMAIMRLLQPAQAQAAPAAAPAPAPQSTPAGAMARDAVGLAQQRLDDPHNPQLRDAEHAAFANSVVDQHGLLGMLALLGAVPGYQVAKGAAQQLPAGVGGWLDSKLPFNLHNTTPPSWSQVRAGLSPAKRFVPGGGQP